MIERKKEKEKIESKGAYAYDLHEAIRDVRRAFANENWSEVGSRLNALFDICAPEIREAINEEWLRIDEKYREELEHYKNAEYEITNSERLHGWNKKLLDNKRYDNGVYRIYVNFNIPVSRFGREEVKRKTRASFLSRVWDEIYRERFRACIDCLDRHGELRKWREVEYGKL